MWAPIGAHWAQSGPQKVPKGDHSRAREIYIERELASLVMLMWPRGHGKATANNKKKNKTNNTK